MRSFRSGMAAVALVGWIGLGVGISGDWSSQLALAGGEASFTHALTLHLTFSGWELESTWDLAAPELNSQALTFQGSLGFLDWQAGLSFHLTGLEPFPNGSGWAAAGLEWTGGFLALELPLGDLNLRLTIITAPAGE